MTEGRGCGLRKCQAERAAGIDGGPRVRTQGGSVLSREMAEFMNHRTLLRQQQQQQQSQWF